MISTSLNHCKEMGVEPGRRFLKQPVAKLEPVIVTARELKITSQHCCDKTVGGKMALYRE